jgi:asparagine synthetase B (glutamine-hydrolysing)
MMQKTLAKVDRASMAHSLEVRVPFLSKPVIELAIQLSPYLSYGPNRKKQLLKDLLQQRLPGAPIDNCKRGFSIPLADWMRKDLFPFFEEELRHLDEVGGRPEVALDLLHQHRLGAAYHWPLFTLTSLVRWRRQCQKSL